MKNQMTGLVAATAFTSLVSAVLPSSATTLSFFPNASDNSAVGSYGGQSFTANDSDFTATGSALGSAFSLVSIEVAKWSTSFYDGTQSAVYANIYDGATFLGSSINTVDFYVNVDGIVGDDLGDAWDFTGVTALQNLDSSTEYDIRYSTTNVAGDFTFVRPGLRQTNGTVLTGGSLLDVSANAADTNFDTRMVIVTDAPVPEPSSLALLGLGGLLVARRRRG